MKVIHIIDNQLAEDVKEMSKQVYGHKKFHKFAEHCLRLGFEEAKKGAASLGIVSQTQEVPSHPGEG